MWLLLCALAWGEEPTEPIEPIEETLPAYEELLPDTASFTTVRKRMYEIVYTDHPSTLYCGCTFADRVVDLTSCEMGELTGVRALRTEAEHIVPASVLGKTRPCWAEGGRAHCIKTDPVFKKAHNDLHNLAPAVGAVNAARSDYGWGLILGESREYGNCDFEIDTDSDRAEPTPDVRGDIARTWFYMEYLYGAPISEGERRLLLAWGASDPVDDWERTRNARVAEIQGNRNPFVVAPEPVSE